MKSSLLTVYLALVFIAFGIWSFQTPNAQADGHETEILGVAFVMIGLSIFLSQHMTKLRSLSTGRQERHRKSASAS